MRHRTSCHQHGVLSGNLTELALFLMGGRCLEEPPFRLFLWPLAPSALPPSPPLMILMLFSPGSDEEEVEGGNMLW